MVVYASKFSPALVLKKTSLNEAFMAGKKNWSQTFQTPENTILSVSETDSFDKIFIASWIEKSVDNSLQTSLQSSFRSMQLFLEFKLQEIVFVDS